MNEWFYKVEGNMLFPDNKYHMLTWGPYYFHDENKAKDKIDIIYSDIINWINLKDPSLNLIPYDEVPFRGKDIKTRVFKCKAWLTEDELVETNCIIQVDNVRFDD